MLFGEMLGLNAVMVEVVYAAKEAVVDESVVGDAGYYRRLAYTAP